jgi:hypothetical protein
MRGEIIGVWSETWREIWTPMAKHRQYGEDFLADLYREIAPPPAQPTEPVYTGQFNEEGALFLPEDLAAQANYEAARETVIREQGVYQSIIANHYQIRKFLRLKLKAIIQTEQAAVGVLESAHAILVNSYDDTYANRFFQLVSQFIQKYSLRYDLRRPFRLNPTLPGVFTSLFRELKEYTARDSHLHTLMGEFEESVRDVKGEAPAGRIKTCLQKQFNLLEAIGQQCPDVNAGTLGGICDQVTYWPHKTIKESLKRLYGFRSDYPGLGHAGNPTGVLREIDMRDMVALSVLLAGFSPYLTDQLDSELIYNGW